MKIDNKSSDQREKKIIDDYWCFNEEQIKFVEAVKVVADRYGMTTHSLSNLVQKNSTCSVYGKAVKNSKVRIKREVMLN